MIILDIGSNSYLIDSVKINIWKNIVAGQDLEAVVKHAIGHALGLKHSENENSIMNQYLANFAIQKISLCDAYNIHIINFGKDSDSPKDKNACNNIE